VISGWLLKLVLSLGLLALVVFEAGSPFIARVQLDGIAADVARVGRVSYEKSGQARQAKAEAEAKAAEEEVALTNFEITREGGVSVTVQRTAPSVVVSKWDKAKSYYDVSVDGLSEKGGEL
jgi:hypothetical protein